MFRRRAVELIQQPDGRRDFLRRPLPLHAARREDQFEQRMTPLDDVQHILQRRARRRGDDADALREAAQAALAFNGEQPLGLELLLELF